MPSYFPDFETFRRLAETHEVIPVYRQLLADHLTPVSAFSVLGRDSHAFLLESVVGGEQIARFSFIATSPQAVYESAGPHATLWRAGQGTQRLTTTDPLADLAALLPPKKFYRHPKLPAFTGGLVGFAGYDTARYYEPDKLSDGPPDDRHLPDVSFGLYRELVVFDHVDKTVRVIANAFVDEAANPDLHHAYNDACRRVDMLVARLSQPSLSRLADIDPASPLPSPADFPFSSNFSKDQFCAAVTKGKEYIKAGDIFQFVPSQRLRVNSSADPLNVYRALRIINPSPYMFFLKGPSCTLIGSSPEILCRVKDGVITSRPLAGTRRRGATPEEDKRLELELLADPKERAEHIMLVDLHRNDVGRVSTTGSVRIADVMAVERYSHVMHIVTDVHGQLAEGKNAMDALKVSLPVGTVSGAPKIRAMQIIDELEPTKRGPYGGGVGYLDFAGNMDICIALRTIVHRNGAYDLQSGAGVVADSIPESEYEETMTKARALLKAVELAQSAFPQ
jgi:anthranilate synthase component 1